ncbi:hypothetical protein [uncultured Eubacterium sp.]|uniref:hypothetical protein n=1 Tax=uncultured Eubacterium sp. TaxID=165185 RepID=UPI0025D413E8|nr:hypothetical protein [uncultured Eubacterium sp.]
MKKKNQDGAVVIEATLSLSAFMFLIVTILSITNICLVQAKMGTMVHGIAKQVSNYTYLYSMTGLDDKEKDLSSGADQARTSLEKITDDSKSVYERIEEIGNVAFDREFWNSFVKLILEQGINESKGLLLDKICKDIAEDRLVSSGQDADSYLHRLGIENGIRGIDFSKSEFMPGGSSDITIVASYRVHVLKLLGVDFEFKFEQCAKTKAWIPAKSASGSSDKK